MELDFRHVGNTGHLNMAPSPTNSIIITFTLQETTICPYKTEALLDDDEGKGEKHLQHKPHLHNNSCPKIWVH
jgi:hypothetical protein